MSGSELSVECELRNRKNQSAYLLADNRPTKSRRGFLPFRNLQIHLNKLAQQVNLKYEEDALIINFIKTNLDLLRTRPIVLQHGDYHDGNLIVDRNGRLGIIDYNRIDWGDPWQEFDKLIWTLLYSEIFPKGMIDGYFNFHVPMEFFQALALYLCVILISNL